MARTPPHHRDNGKRGLGLIHHAGKIMPWGKGAVASGFVFLSGAEARSDSDDVPPKRMKAQVELVMERIKARLEEAGTSIDNTVKFVWYIADRSQMQDFYDARDGWLERNAPSMLKNRSYASTLLVVGLARHDMLVEVDCIAFVPKPAGSLPKSRR
jgi:enamine deaminase RidA (YjgF/YER057c/UK114 family)